jgi:multiple sugar transport system permease protein
MAGSLMMILPILVVFMIGQRYFVEGIKLTGIKG